MPHSEFWTSRPFAFVDRQRFPWLTTFDMAIASHDEARSLMCQHADYRNRVATDLSIRHAETGVTDVRRFYWSAQQWHRDLGTFRAETLSYSRKKGTTCWLAFPTDPRLQGAARVLQVWSDVRVLQYVPQRRLTFLAATPTGRLIVKVKREDRWAEAAERLRSAGHHLASTSFVVPALQTTDPTHCSFTQTACDGTPLVDLLREPTALALMATCGATHAELNDAATGTAPDVTSADVLTRTVAAARAIAAVLPSASAPLDACLAQLARRVPDEDTPIFCHGDLDGREILVARDRWAVVDFDLWHWGSRYRDVAICLTNLERQWEAAHTATASPIAWTAAEAAYLDGYEQRHGERLEQGSLCWFRASAEIEALALMVQKDTYTPSLFANGLTKAEEMSRQAAA